jgi:gas vesicle protein
MPELPKYGRKVAAPGPVPYGAQAGPLYNQGLSVIADQSRDVAAILKEKADRIQQAQDATEIIGRTADFSVKMQNILQESQRLGTPEERQKFFDDQSEQVKNNLLDWNPKNPEAKARLLSSITSEYTQHQIGFMQQEEKTALADMAVKLQSSEDEFIRTNNEAGYRQLMTHPAILPEVAKRKLAEFPVNSQLASIRQRIDTLDQTDAPVETRVQGLESLAVQLEALNNGTMTDKQREQATRLLDWTRQDAKALKLAGDKAKKDAMDATGRAVYSDTVTFDATGGKQGKKYTPSQLGDLYVAGALGKDQYDSLVKIATGQGQPDPWSALQGELLVTDVDSGRITLENAMVRQMELAPNLTVDERAKFNRDLAKARSSWRGQLRRKGEAAIEDAINPPGTIIPVPGTVAAVAKMQFWDAIREAEDKQEVLAEEKFVPMAVDLATRTLAEYKANRGGFNASHGFSSSGKSPEAVPAGEPKTIDEFTRTVQSMADEGQARAYYDRWKDKF